uniref:Cytochrome c oxidase subunit 3 n=1 Tax=Cerophytidae sp. BMNH 900085 TaxID=1903808 RepID=A0A343A4I8_9COLE|nr:cytochrome c oxidase subunit 3 [Cerophytidae sp. BMNH 900085]
MFNHPFHLVNFSPWPILCSLNIMFLMMSVISSFLNFSYLMFYVSLISLMIISMLWWRDIIRESTFQGFHTIKVAMGLRLGMMLFILSEILFFISFFWTFFHSSLTPSMEIGLMWPPLNILSFNPMHIPLLNTMILISSGVSITWAHHALMENNYKELILGICFTVMFGLYFSILQFYEYLCASFCLSDSIYGSIFFMATGFHGLHVIIGSVFLLTCLLRTIFNQFSQCHHFGLEAAAWYWHFVDVVWLFLYISIYWWGS